MALAYSDITVNLREISLKNRPQALYGASSKGTVPVLCVNSTKNIDESLDIMIWALNQNDPDLWNFKGVTLRSLGRYDEAVECFNRSLKIDPRDKNTS